MHSSVFQSVKFNVDITRVLCVICSFRKQCTRVKARLNASVFFTKQETKHGTNLMAPQRGRDGLLSMETLIAGLYGVFFSIRRHLICMWLASTETIEASARHLRLTFGLRARLCSQTHVCVEYHSWRQQTKGVCLVSPSISYSIHTSTTYIFIV